MIAVGFSGVVAEVLGRTAGPSFVAGDPSGVTYTPQRCADYFEYFPHAATCADAAALHHWGEIVEYRVAVGVLGVLALLALWFARRYTTLRRPTWTPPRAAVAAPMVALFGLAAFAFGGLGVLQLVFGDTDKVGANLSDGVVASLAALAVLGSLLLRSRTHRAGRPDCAVLTGSR